METTNTTTTSERRIDGFEVSPRVGRYLISDEMKIGCLLEENTDDPVPGWEGSDFRWGIGHISIDVHITGRTVQFKWESAYVRVKVEVVNDCEPNTFFSGWMDVSQRENVFTRKESSLTRTRFIK